MITKEQCRAARNFLGLKQSELASDCGLSKTAITHFESGLFHPRAENMANIRAALEKRGIEFVGTYGIQKRQTLFQLLEGEMVHLDLWDPLQYRHKDLALKDLQDPLELLESQANDLNGNAVFKPDPLNH